MAKESKSETIATRLPAEMRQRLDDVATRRGVTVGEYLRGLVEKHLDDAIDPTVADAVDGLQDELARLREEVSKLRRDIALTLETVLVNLTDGQETLVQRFIDEHLRDRPGP